MTIHKFPVSYGSNKILARQRCKVLSAGLDIQGQLCVWVLLDPTADEYVFTVAVVFTGETFYPTKDSFIGTVVDGRYVYHVFTP